MKFGKKRGLIVQTQENIQKLKRVLETYMNSITLSSRNAAEQFVLLTIGLDSKEPSTRELDSHLARFVFNIGKSASYSNNFPSSVKVKTAND